MNKIIDNSHNYDYNFYMKYKLSKKKTINLILSFSSLLIGSLNYIIYRPYSYISEFSESQVTKTIRNLLYNEHILFFSYYISDFLWALSFCLILCCILRASQSAAIVLIFGVLWETMQLFGFFSGTGDIIDVLMYLAAVITSVIINIYLKETKK